MQYRFPHFQPAACNPSQTRTNVGLYGSGTRGSSAGTIGQRPGPVPAQPTPQHVPTMPQSSANRDNGHMQPAASVRPSSDPGNRRDSEAQQVSPVLNRVTPSMNGSRAMLQSNNMTGDRSPNREFTGASVGGPGKCGPGKSSPRNGVQVSTTPKSMSEAQSRINVTPTSRCNNAPMNQSNGNLETPEKNVGRNQQHAASDTQLNRPAFQPQPRRPNENAYGQSPNKEVPRNDIPNSPCSSPTWQRQVLSHEKRYFHISPTRERCSQWLTREQLGQWVVREQAFYEPPMEYASSQHDPRIRELRNTVEEMNGGMRSAGSGETQIMSCGPWLRKRKQGEEGITPPPLTEAQLNALWNYAETEQKQSKEPPKEAQQQRRAQEPVGVDSGTADPCFRMEPEEKCKLLIHTISYFQKMINTSPAEQMLQGYMYKEEEMETRRQTFEMFKEDTVQSVSDAGPTPVTDFIVRSMLEGKYDIVSVVISVYYMAQFKEKVKVPLHIQTWKNLFITCLVISDKMWEDIAAKNSEMCKILYKGKEQQPAVKKLYAMEIDLLKCLDWRLCAFGEDKYCHWQPWVHEMQKQSINSEVEMVVNRSQYRRDVLHLPVPTTQVPSAPRVPSQARSNSPNMPGGQPYNSRGNVGNVRSWNHGGGPSPVNGFQRGPDLSKGSSPPPFNKPDPLCDGEGTASGRKDPSTARTDPNSNCRASSHQPQDRGMGKQPHPGPKNPVPQRATIGEPIANRQNNMLPGKSQGLQQRPGMPGARNVRATGVQNVRQPAATGSAASTPPKSTSATNIAGSSLAKPTTSAGDAENTDIRRSTTNTGNAADGATQPGAFNRSGRSSSPAGIVEKETDSSRGRGLGTPAQSMIGLQQARVSSAPSAHTSMQQLPSARGVPSNMQRDAARSQVSLSGVTAPRIQSGTRNPGSSSLPTNPGNGQPRNNFATTSTHLNYPSIQGRNSRSNVSQR